ncbi:hypothetical protein CIB48_g6213 [Xylaria polymorpha]|nr:hypothetical protein CIB48_g6213 [Xylaria polymorpha]
MRPDLVNSMAGTIIITGANGSVAVHAVQQLLSKAPDNTLVLAVRNTSDSDVNTKRLREVVKSFPDSKVSIRKLDLASSEAVHVFAGTIVTEVEQEKLPPLTAIVCNAFHWNMIADPELTDDGLEKTIQSREIPSRYTGRPGGAFTGGSRNRQAGPRIPELRELEIGYLDVDLAQDKSLSKISAVVIDPGNIADSRALRTNTPVILSYMQRFVLQPLQPVLRLVVPDVRRSADAGADVAEIVLNQKHANERGYFRLMVPGPSSAESLDETKQERLWVKTAEWAKITKEDTALEGVF